MPGKSKMEIKYIKQPNTWLLRVEAGLVLDPVRISCPILDRKPLKIPGN